LCVHVAYQRATPVCRIYQTQSAVARNSQTGGNLIKSSESIPLLRYLFCIKIYRRQLGALVAVVGGTAYIHHQQQNSALVLLLARSIELITGRAAFYYLHPAARCR